MTEIKYFDYDRSNLTESEGEVLEALIDAAKAMHTVWQKQVDQKTGRLLVLPEDATREELVEAAKDNPDILDSATVVRRVKDGFETVHYKDEYATELKEFQDALTRAAEATDDKKLKKYIGEIIDACKKGDYDAALVAYLTNGDPKIEFLSGPLETYEDAVLGSKRTFQFNLRVKKAEGSEEVADMIDVIKNIRLPQPDTSLGSDLQASEINIRIDDVILFAGRQSRSLISSTNLPNESELVAKYGTKVAVYTTSMDEKFDVRHVPLLPYFEGGELTDDVDGMKKAMFRWIALHEIAEATVKFKGVEKRMGKCFAYIRELNAHVVGLDSLKYQLLNGIISLEDYKKVLSASVIFGVDVCNMYSDEGILLDYAKGFAILFNYFIQSGAMIVKDKKVTLDHILLSRDLEHLSDLTLKILEEGNEDDAQKLFDEYGSFDLFSELPNPGVKA